MKQRGTSNDGVCKVHHQIDASVNWHVDSIQPLRLRKAVVILRISQKVHLMNMEGVHFLGAVYYPPVVIRPNGYRRHWRIGHAELLAIDVKAAFVLRKSDNEVGSTILDASNLGPG